MDQEDALRVVAGYVMENQITKGEMDLNAAIQEIKNTYGIVKLTASDPVNPTGHDLWAFVESYMNSIYVDTVTRDIVPDKAWEPHNKR